LLPENVLIASRRHYAASNRRNESLTRRVCIYCRATISDPPREHVIPVAFGTFKNNPVLRCVCADCNHRFSSELELRFARDSGEGFVRAYFSLRPNVFETTKNSIVTLTLPPTWQGARVRIHENPKGGRPLFEMIPQVALKRGDAWDWITEDDITHERLTDYLNHAVDVKVACNSAAEYQRLTEKLCAVGVRLKGMLHYDINSLSSERLQATVRYELNDTTARCVAKIAFNYLAWSFGPQLVLNESFDEVRTYILHGDLCGQQAFVYIRDKSLLVEEQAGGKATNGHIVVAGCGVEPDQIVGHVALFNAIRYDIMLSRRYVGLCIPLDTGHHFDVERRKISKLLLLARE
jgi:hypothetical protein